MAERRSARVHPQGCGARKQGWVGHRYAEAAGQYGAGQGQARAQGLWAGAHMCVSCGKFS
eukprot:scaffold62552_cov69-Phaeocystis_antarctica.AAC.1